MTKTIALVHPSFVPPFLFEAAAKNDVALVAILPPGTEITTRYPAVIAYEYLPLYDDPEAALAAMPALHERWKFDGIISPKEYSIIFAAQAAKKLGLRGLAPEITKNARSKAVMRELFRESGLVTPQFMTIAGAHEVELCRAMPFPCVVKPSSGANSDGVQRVENWDELVRACTQIDDLNKSMYDGFSQLDGKRFSGIIVEQYIEGREFAVELFAHEGEVHALNCGYKGHPTGPYFEETVYLSPPMLPEEKIREIQAVAVAGMRALKLDNGPGHCELRLDGQGRPVIIEIAARMGGAGCAQVNVEQANGIDYAGLWFASATGGMTPALWPPRPDGSGRAGTSWIVPMNGSGVLKSVEGLDKVRAHPDCYRVLLCGEIGKTYRPLPYFDGFPALIFGAHDSPAAGQAFFDFLEQNVTVVWGEA